MALWKASTTKSEWRPDDPTAFAPTKPWKLPFITTWGGSPNRNLPTNSAEEADFLQSIPEKFDSCNVTLTEHFENNAVRFTTRYSVPLGSIIDSHIKHLRSAIAGAFISGSEWHYELTLNTKLKEISSLLTTVFGGDGLPSPPSVVVTDSVRIIFDDELTAKRVQDAFRHASDLCRKKEPF